VESFAESWSFFLDVGTVFLADCSHNLREYRVRSAKRHKGAVLLGLEGVDTIEKAESFKGSVVMANKESFKKQADEYFWFELLGLEVYCEGGLYVGRLSQIIPTPANDIYVVTKGQREYLIPATVDVVRHIDLEKGTMIIWPLEGMLDIDES